MKMSFDQLWCNLHGCLKLKIVSGNREHVITTINFKYCTGNHYIVPILIPSTSLIAWFLWLSTCEPSFGYISSTSLSHYPSPNTITFQTETRFVVELQSKVTHILYVIVLYHDDQPCPLIFKI